MSLADVVASGDRRASLEAIRDMLANAMEDATPRDMAAIAARLSAVIAEVDALPAKEASPLDEISARRASRRSAASVRKLSTASDIGGR